MLACWSVKGGVGTTVVVAGLAVAGGLRRDGPPVLVVDLGGDVPALFGAPDPPGPGLAGWLAAGPGVPPDAIGRLTCDLGRGISLIPRGDGPLSAARAGALAQALAADPRSVIIDAGRWDEGSAAACLTEAAERSLLVTRACPLSLRRLEALPHPPSGVVVVREPRRRIPWQTIAEVSESPVVAELDVDPAVAAAVDAGLGRRDLPRAFVRALADLW